MLKPLAIQDQDDRFIRVAVRELVFADAELRDVRLEDRVAAHVVEHARVVASALFPAHDFRIADVGHQVAPCPNAGGCARARVKYSSCPL